LLSLVAGVYSKQVAKSQPSTNPHHTHHTHHMNHAERIHEIEKSIRSFRLRCFDMSESEYEREAAKVAEWKKELFALRDSVDTKGPFSGLTKKELSMSGTCESDWF
jgi:hypothetical protein